MIAARGVFGTFLGPWSAGSALVLLIRAAGRSASRGFGIVRRGRHGRGHASDGIGRESGRRRNSHGRRGHRNPRAKRRSDRRSALDRRRNRGQGSDLQCRPQAHAAEADRSHSSFARLRAEASALPRQRHGRESQSRAFGLAQVHCPEEWRFRRASRDAFTLATKSTISSALSTNQNMGTSRSSRISKPTIPSLDGSDAGARTAST